MQIQVDLDPQHTLGKTETVIAAMYSAMVDLSDFASAKLKLLCQSTLYISVYTYLSWNF
jgi:hypothetical protein